MRQIESTPRAQADLIGIWLYTANNNRSAADGLLSRIEEILEMLALHPLIGRSREELAPDLRSFTVGSNIIFYRPLDDGIEVIRVLHSSRDLGIIF